MKEIIIIKTSESEKIKSLLNPNEIIHSEIIYENEEDYWRAEVRAASQDEQRNKEITAWDKIASKVKDK